MKKRLVIYTGSGAMSGIYPEGCDSLVVNIRIVFSRIHLATGVQ